MSNRAKKIINILSIIVFIVVVCILAYVSLKFALDKEQFKLWMDNHGVFGRVVFVVMVILQIMVALIPGGPMEIAGGYAFGAWQGIWLFTLGATIGSIVVFLLVRRYGQSLVEIYFKSHEIKKLKFLEEDKKRDLIFMILFFIPGTPKDLLCYVAGLTKMRFKVFLFICSVGRLPAIIGSALSGSLTSDNNYLLAGIVLAITLLLSSAGVLIYYLIVKKKTGNNDK